MHAVQIELADVSNVPEAAILILVLKSLFDAIFTTGKKGAEENHGENIL